jgi:hypothetical protein
MFSWRSTIKTFASPFLITTAVAGTAKTSFKLLVTISTFANIPGFSICLSLLISTATRDVRLILFRAGFTVKIFPSKSMPG